MIIGDKIGSIATRIATHSCGDCTSQYTIRLHKDYTVGEFLDACIEAYPDEWGFIYVTNCTSAFYKAVSYKKGKIEDGYIPYSVLTKSIKRITAHGGWSRMDYSIVLMPDKKKADEAHDYENKSLEIIIDERNEEIVLPRRVYSELIKNLEDGTFVNFNGSLYRLIVCQKDDETLEGHHNVNESVPEDKKPVEIVMKNGDVHRAYKIGSNDMIIQNSYGWIFTDGANIYEPEDVSVWKYIDD